MCKNKISLIASDIDGTLLDSKSCLAKRTRRALLCSHEQGIHTVIATGRSFKALPKALRHLEALEYVITSNGTSIFRQSDGSRIYGADNAKRDGQKQCTACLKCIRTRLRFLLKGRHMP